MKKSIIIIILVLITSTHIFGEEINLIKNTVYIKQGFKNSWTKTKEADNSWTPINSHKKLKNLRLAALKIPILPERSFLSLKTLPPQNYTLLFPFHLNEIISFPGIYFNELGPNWEVYINGHLIEKEIHIEKDGSLTKERTLRNLVLYINPNYLIKGKNSAVLRIYGDPTNPNAGIYRFPVLIDNYNNLIKNQDERFTLILIFIYLAIGLFHIFLFFNRRSETYNLFFGLATTSYFLYIFSRTSAVITIIPDTHFVNRFELIILYLILPFFGAFANLIISKRISIITKCYFIFSLTLVLLTLFFSDAFSMDILVIWQISALPYLLYMGFWVVGLSFGRNVKIQAFRFEEKSPFVKWLKGIGNAFSKTVSGNVLVGIMVIIACAVFDIIDQVYLLKGLSLSKYGMFFFIAGIAAVLSNRFLYIHKSVENLNIYLEQKIEDLNLANETIQLSEERYRLIIEGSEDIIFSLDENLKFKNVNNALKKKLKIDPKKILTKNFFDFIKEGADGQSLEFQYVFEKLDELKKTKNPVFFKVSFKSPYTLEPFEMNVKLEYINIKDKNEILGKLSNVIEDTLLQYFTNEHSTYNIGNYLSTVEEISHRITRNLNKYIDGTELNMIRLALREILINAIEHGNLEISFDDKTEALQSENYFKLISAKQHDAQMGQRQVEVEYRITNSSAIFKITDQGKGFDHKKIMEKVSTANEEMLSHGRGIIMANSVFDEITFSKKGNQVLLIKNLKPLFN